MAVRQFNGTSDWIQFGGGTGIGAFNSGSAGMSMVLLVKPTTIQAGGDFCFLSANTATPTSLMCIYDHSNGELAWGSDDPGFDTGLPMGLSAGAWQVIGLDKAAGTAAVRMHRKVLGSGSWTHTSGGAPGNTGTTCAQFTLGRFPGVPGYKDFRCAWAAFFTSQLTDTDYVNIESNATTAYLNSLGPKTLWELNQSTATSVPDLTATGASSSGVTGTTAVTGDDPAWTFGLGGGAPDAVSQTITQGAQAIGRPR